MIKAFRMCKLAMMMCFMVPAAVFAAGEKQQDVTMLVIPAQYSVVQVGMDIYRSYPTILLSYQGGSNGTDPVLYAWNGREWLYISCDDYEAGRFFREPLARAVLIGDAATLPELLADGPVWTPLVIKVPTIKTPELINSLGKVYGFDEYTWIWFARRFGLELVDINQPAGQLSWYDGEYVEEVQADGSIRKIYVPPEGAVSPDNFDVEVLKIERQAQPAGARSTAEGVREVDEVYVDVEENASRGYTVEELETRQQTWTDESGAQIEAEEMDEFIQTIPPPAPPILEAPPLYFGYTDEDIEALQDAK